MIEKKNFNLQWWLILAVVAFSTFDFGGLYPRTIFITRLLVCFTFALQLILFFSEKNYLDDFKSALNLSLLLFLAFLALAFLQYAFGLNVLQGTVIGTINRQATENSLFQLIIYFVFFMACLKVFAKKEAVERLVFFIIILTFIIAISGLVQKLSANERILWKAMSAGNFSFFGPFTNENNFGGFLALTFPLALGLMHYHFDKVRTRFASEPKPLWQMINAFVNEGVVFLFFLIILTLVACFFALARVSLAVLILCSVSYFSVYALAKRNARFFLTLLIILACSLLLVLWIKDGFIPHHFKLGAFQSAWNLRFDVAKQSLVLLREYPWFGTGLGTYGFISSKVISRLANEVWWTHAHNDYVELLTDTGVVGFILFTGALMTSAFIALSRINKISPWNKFILTQAIISLCAFGIMELSDFHLRLSSIAFLFTLQLALLFQTGSSSENNEQKVAKDSSPRIAVIGRSAIMVIGLAVLSFLAAYSVRDFRASSSIELEFGNRFPDLKKALRLQPSNATLWYFMGKEYQMEAYRMSARPEQVQKIKQEAINAFRKAVSLSPTYHVYWFDLGVLEYSTGYEKEGIASLEKAVYWAPFKLKYSVYLLGVYLRESKKAGSLEERLKFLTKARAMYRELQRSDVKLRPNRYPEIMGDYYYQKLLQLAAGWERQDHIGS